MAAWDRDRGIGNKPVGEPEAAPAKKKAGDWYQTMRRLTEQEKAERNIAEWKAAKVRSIL